MAVLPKTQTNWREYEAYTVAASFTLTAPSNVSNVVLLEAGAIAGTNQIYLPSNFPDGDTIGFVSQYAISGLTVSVQSGSGATILAGPAAATAIAAGSSIKYIKIGLNWLRVA
jgi:hypothetical protein